MRVNDKSITSRTSGEDAMGSPPLKNQQNDPPTSPFPSACALPSPDASPNVCALPSPDARGKTIKLQTYMIYLILPMILIPVLLMAFMGIWLSYRSAQNVNQWFHNFRESELIMIAERPVFFRYAKAMEEMRMSSAHMYRSYFHQWLKQFIDRSNKYETVYLWIQVVNSKGREILRVLADVSKLPENIKNEAFLHIPEASEIVARTKTAKDTLHWHFDQGSIHILSVPIWFDRDENGNLSPDEYLGALTAGFQYPRSYIMYIVKRSLIFTGCIIALALLVSYMTVYRRFRRLVEPIRHLATISRRFATGDLSARAEIHVNVSEVQDMCDAFNSMACDIECILEERNRYAQDLCKLNEDLEKKVLERTRELRRLNKELQSATRHKSEFLANMSHELRTPMNAILGFTELIQDGIYGQIPPKMTEIIEKVQHNGTHLLNLINDVLDLSKIEAGRIELSKTDFRAAACIESVVSNATSLAARKGLKVKTEIPDRLPIGYGDEKRVNQILWNLVSNAIKFTQEGEVTVGVKGEDGWLHFFVEDTGMGIPADRIGELFQEFRQLDSSNTKKFGGTGLGLSISKKLAEMHGGRIWVESEEGKGSVFHFSLPFKDQADPGSSASEE